MGGFSTDKPNLAVITRESDKNLRYGYEKDAWKGWEKELRGVGEEDGVSTIQRNTLHIHIIHKKHCAVP